MYLKSLTLRGFKSFASATTLAFEPGITAIVGPNGSGKSNIVDALAWVMGEQGAKHLRGSKMEDVIFAGTSGRSPLGRAEVTLTIDNTDGTLPIDYTEVTISRTLFRAGGSEYAINGQTARLLDVQELLSDTGMGREMHVIVGQGQLDQILQATPEQRRGFIEEAAGVLKHRRRKEKASRKLESTRANLDRLNDLISEIRRQLKPLGRQANVARKAAVVQAELRDAKARLMADDLTTVQLALASDSQNRASQEKMRADAQAQLDATREDEKLAEAAVAAANPALAASQETLYRAVALRERIATIKSVSAERMRHGSDGVGAPQGRDPEELEAEAAEIRAQEDELRAQVDEARKALTAAQQKREAAEKAAASAEQEYARQLRTVADRREGLARLTGQVDALKSRLQAGAEEIERLAQRRDDAKVRAEEADSQYLALENQIAGLGDGESDLDMAYEKANDALEEQKKALQEVIDRQADVEREIASLIARIDALQLGLERRDGTAALSEQHIDGVHGAVAELLEVEAGWETAVASALGPAAEALVANNIETAQIALKKLADEDLGQASLILKETAATKNERIKRSADARFLVGLVTVPTELTGAINRLLSGFVAVDTPAQAAQIVADNDGVTAVTRDGELLSSWFASGGSDSGQSRIEVEASLKAAREELTVQEHEADRLRFAYQKTSEAVKKAEQLADAALERLNESDAAMTALAEQISGLGQRSAAAHEEMMRAENAMEKASTHRAEEEHKLAELQERLDAAAHTEEIAEPDPAHRDELVVVARLSRQKEMDARLALRTGEERANSLAGRADSLSRAAARERQSRAEAARRAQRVLRETAVATCVNAAAQWLADQAEILAGAAQQEKEIADLNRIEAEARVSAARTGVHEATSMLEKLVEGAHREEMARIEQQMRIESMTEKIMEELGLEADTLIEEFGPDKLIPVLIRKDGSALTDDDEQPEPVAFDRTAQEKRLRSAQRALDQLGRINPLALEEFDALNERHQFLAEQLEDLKRTRKDLQDIISDVDVRVQEVFTQAYNDVEATFSKVFAQLFPGGEGRMVLTNPDDMLNTGIDIEARPAGKKVRRMSLLSGGERSMVAVAFLFSLFIARPSPFYILDEIEAALDDSNLTRLLGIYEELRKDSQLLVITHQKRTMEHADSLYGVTMRGDGVTTVISQRLVD